MRFQLHNLNGRRFANSTLYYFNPKIEFEGEYSNGKRWNGYIKEYQDNDVLLFEGEYKNGVKEGNGKQYDLNVLSN